MTTSAMLALNAALQVFASCILGLLLLASMQPWGRELSRWVKQPRALVAAHLDWIMLALLQFATSFTVERFTDPEASTSLMAALLLLGGWLNPVPYIARALGVNAFVLGGGRLQRTFAVLGLVSVTALLVGWGLLIASLANGGRLN